jgi:hypothetical protein
MAELTEDEHLRIVAQLGVEAQTFKTSTLGQYLADCAEAESTDALAQLATVDPTSVQEIVALQNQVFRAQSVMTWIEEAIEGGTHAIGTMQQREEES